MKYFLSLSRICFKNIFITSLLIIILTGNAFSNSHIGAAILIVMIFSMGIYHLRGKRRVLFLSISLLLLVGSGNALAGRYSNNGITWWDILKRDINPVNNGTHP